METAAGSKGAMEDAELARAKRDGGGNWERARRRIAFNNIMVARGVYNLVR